MDFEIDVSGSDIFAHGYTIVVAEAGNGRRMLAHKFADAVVQVLRARHGQGEYRYPNSKRGKSDLKIRLYCVAIYYLFKELKRRHKFKDANLDVCRDFSGNEADIKQSLQHLLGSRLGLRINVNFVKLPKGSIADKYSSAIRRDKSNRLKKFCLELGVSEFEAFLVKPR